MAQHRHSCVRNSQSLVWKRLRWMHSLVLKYISSSQTHKFDLALSNGEKAAWNAFQQHETGGFFLKGSVKAIKFRKLVEDLVTSCEKLGCNSHSHMDSFLVNSAAMTNTLGVFSRASQQGRTDTRTNSMLPFFASHC
jgi:hypothetical protein